MVERKEIEEKKKIHPLLEANQEKVRENFKKGVSWGLKPEELAYNPGNLSGALKEEIENRNFEEIKWQLGQIGIEVNIKDLEESFAQMEKNIKKTEEMLKEAESRKPEILPPFVVSDLSQELREDIHNQVIKRLEEKFGEIEEGHINILKEIGMKGDPGSEENPITFSELVPGKLRSGFLKLYSEYKRQHRNLRE
jgi:hypothetical protein